MAKWGEGDPRWIVEERPDSTNVNNWHWTDYNCTPWVHSYIHANVPGVSVQQGAVDVKITKVDDLEGTVTISNRKGKVKFYYELTFSVLWEGDTDKANGKGSIKVIELTQDDQLDDYNYEVTVSEGSDERKAFTDVIKKQLMPKLCDKMKEVNQAILKEYGQKVILPTKDAADKAASAAAASAAQQKASSANGASGASAADKPKSSIKTKTLRLEVDFLASANDLYDALTNPGRVQIWTQAAANISTTPNSDLALFGGNVTGKTLEAAQGSKLKQSWRLSQWPAGHYSTVTISFEQGSSSTLLKLTQEGVPEEHFESTEQNWTRYYFDRIKAIFGWGILSSI